jgi:hypothetical protein
MRQFMMAVMALVVFGATVATAQAEKQTVRRLQTASAAHSTCTGMKAVCLSPPDLEWRQLMSGSWGGTLEGARPYNEKVCNFYWEQCMKTGWWEGYLQHRAAERR